MERANENKSRYVRIFIRASPPTIRHRKRADYGTLISWLVHRSRCRRNPTDIGVNKATRPAVRRGPTPQQMRICGLEA